MTRLNRLLSAALAATSVAALGTSVANAVTIVRPTINIPTIKVAPVRPVIPTVTHAPSLPTHAPSLPATHAPASVSPVHTHVSAPDPNSVPWANVGAATTLNPNVAVPAHTGPAIAAVFNGKPVIKLTNVSGNETTVYYLSRDQKHIVAAISSISAPATHAPPQNVATTQPAANHPAAANEPANSSPKVTFAPVSYPELTDALGRPMGYVNAQGQAVYFPNGQMPHGFVVGPNHTIQTYVESTTTPAPAPAPVSKPAPAPAPQQPPSSKPAANSGHTVTYTPVKYPELTDAYGAPIGYVNAQGQAVYFPNGHMPAGFSVGPNHTIETYVKS